MKTTQNDTQIIRIQAKKNLEKKLSVFQKENKNIDDDMEQQIVSFFVSELILHGKDSSQIYQISKVSKLLGVTLDLDLNTCDILEDAAKIYDVGNLLIDKNIYIKEEKLTFEEFNIVKTHTMLGYQMLKFKGFPSTNLATVISAEHHEWWDGGGYPNQKKNTSINISSRIVAVADAVGALSRKRPGRAVWDYEKIVNFVKTRSGTQFDPSVVEVFIANEESIYDILYLDIENISYE
ncbi:MAG: HD domain-containing protein [Sulfurovum sp.]|nr:HD domain-containing protein [Sulfurovum sp.]